MTYLDKIVKEAAAARHVLQAKDVDKRYCQFGPGPEPSTGRIWAPAQAMTKFQMEQAMGDWAEDRVREGVNRDGSPFKAIPFGDNDKTLSQDQSFADLYRAGKQREMEFGKRADLLLFSADTDTPADASVLSGPEAEQLAAACVAALEIRSSRTSAHKFVEYNQSQVEMGKKPGRMEPSFTVKVEDLAKVFRWIARNKKPMLYIQVFFDSIYALDVLEAFRFINACGHKLKLESPARSAKKTIMIPVSKGAHLGTVVPPSFDVVHTQHDNGRHDIYARPFGGEAHLDLERLAAMVS